MSHVQPPGTIEYKVDSNDTIERIALKWNTIPSDILHINRLSSRLLYPGQILYVPDPNYVPPPPPPIVSSPVTKPSSSSPPKVQFNFDKPDRLSHLKVLNYIIL